MIENWLIFIRLIGMLDWMQKHLELKIQPWQVDIMAKMYAYDRPVQIRTFWQRSRSPWKTYNQLMEAINWPGSPTRCVPVGQSTRSSRRRGR